MAVVTHDIPHVEEGYSAASALVLALSLVGAGLLAVGLFIEGLMLSQTERLSGDIYALSGLAGYLAVWTLSLLFVKHS